MGHYVHIHVCFACNENDHVAQLAAKHLPGIPAANDHGGTDGVREAMQFLEDLAQRTGGNIGPKGGLSLWGMVGNYTLEDVFVHALMPFWSELLAGVEGGPNDFEHVLVFVEHEQQEQATAIEIFRDGDAGGMVVKKHLCPFAFMQF